MRATLVVGLTRPTSDRGLTRSGPGLTPSEKTSGPTSAKTSGSTSGPLAVPLVVALDVAPDPLVKTEVSHPWTATHSSEAPF